MISEQAPRYRHCFRLHCCRRGKKWTFHHQGSSIRPGLSDFTIRTILHTDLGLENFPIINVAAAKNWLAASVIPLIANPFFKPDLAPADFFLFPKLVVQLADLSFAQESLKKTWVGVSHRRDVCRRVLPLV